jgi:hypothetical protein
MQPTTAVPKANPNPDHITIPIHVQTVDNPGVGRKGSFTSPPPRIEVLVDDQIKWQITAGQTFELNFSSYPGTGQPSPFAQTTISDSNFYPVVNKGDFHYTIVVKDANGNPLGEIKHCPEVGVGN